MFFDPNSHNRWILYIVPLEPEVSMSFVISLDIDSSGSKGTIWGYSHALQIQRHSGIFCSIKGACSKIFVKRIFFKLTEICDHFSSQYYHPRWKNCKFVSLYKVISENNVNVIYYFIKWLKPHFPISESVFQSLLLNYREFVHETSHIKASTYDSTSGTKTSMFEKFGGMRMSIRISMFNNFCQYRFSRILPLLLKNSLLYMPLSAMCLGIGPFNSIMCAIWSANKTMN